MHTNIIEIFNDKKTPNKPDSSLLYLLQFEHGEMRGEQLRYDEYTHIETSNVYKDGRLHGRGFLKDAMCTRNTMYKHGHKHGFEKTVINPTGEELSGNYDRGYKHGDWQDGDFIVTYRDGVIIKKVKKENETKNTKTISEIV